MVSIRPGGLIYLASLTLAKANGFAQGQYVAAESGTTGREVLGAGMTRSPSDPIPHP